MLRSRFASHRRPASVARPFSGVRTETVRFAFLVLSLALAILLGACADSSDSATDTMAAAGAMEGATASEPGTAAASSDAATLASYELRMEQVDKYFDAFRNIGRALQGMTPAEREALDFEASDTDFNGYVARLESRPALNEAIREAGLTAREFSLVLWSMLQSGMAAAVMQAQPNVDQDSLAAAMQVNMDNVRFMREHEAELQQKQQALDAEMERIGVADDAAPDSQ